ncbi:NusB antitermination factor [Candidatus Desulfofervidus auxilii]|uniref:Transcription antitermination protein NusB n=1 Tax=Desulfofervidus auxilii TaxID=1621989 RepID=A0A7V1P3A1_DESA2|nr:transcription antitermination factor NusB [Candidatus Desulfofervidus auxilii]CAD7774908.1 MAG: Transcription antitermination protein NusB [Candidatus Methanoperedenaceae archaeon GB50]CAD7776007.1 MAG: Transcription antitermination protein NusB [Candidatus Methanoperedenaceae archaeon GB37]AMM40893.1 NusB antitermination factor [Candidatus Desulfofervidus auxilii]CAD7775170.1 Transcription antitermination protein NusB [Candidatus Methanoperedenaceae archaeon GB50]CAD7776654.1 Transcription
MEAEPPHFSRKARHKARAIALQVLYQKEIIEEPLENIWAFFCKHYQYPKESLDYAWKLVQGVVENQPQIDLLLGQYAPHWQIERMPFIERNILRLATYEMLYISDVPPKVSINEAIELAKIYGSKTSSTFVNAILDAIYHKEIKGK